MTEEAPLALPRWLESLLPEEKNPLVLRAQIEDQRPVLILEHPSGSTSSFSTVEELVESKELNEGDLLIDTTALKLFGDGKTYIEYDPGRKNYHGFLMSYTDARRRKALEQSYRYFLEALSSYEGDSEDFYAAWNFVDSHPAFWTAHELKEHPWHWETAGYCSKIHQYVNRGKNGLTVSLSGGGHVEQETAPGRPPYSEHYGDWRLDSKGSTFEESMIDFAHRVWLSFDSEGNSLSEDDFPHEVPEWIQDLRAVQDDYEDED